MVSAALCKCVGETRTTVFVSGSEAHGGSTAAETSGLLLKTCPGLIITLDRDKADYIVIHDDTGAGPGRKPQKLTVFNRAHELILATATRSIRGAAKDACRSIRNNQGEHK